MQTYKFPLLITILFLVQVMSAQEWSRRIAIMEAHLSEITYTEEQNMSSELQLALIQDEGDAFVVRNENLSAGVNLMFEEVLENGFFIKDMFAYSIGVSYDVGRFGLSFSFENFLNAGQQESGILPIPEYVGKDAVNAVTYELDSPYFVALGLSYSF